MMVKAFFFYETVPNTIFKIVVEGKQIRFTKGHMPLHNHAQQDRVAGISLRLTLRRLQFQKV